MDKNKLFFASGVAIPALIAGVIVGSTYKEGKYLLSISAFSLLAGFAAGYASSDRVMKAFNQE